MVEGISTLQHFVARALAFAPQKRDFYDSLIQERSNTKGKPIYDIQRGKSKKPNAETLRLIAEVLEQPYELISKAAAGFSVEPSRIAPDVPPTMQSDDDTVEILSVDLSFSMGPGTSIDDYIEETPVRFGMSFLRAITRSPFERLRLARGVGDSMFPTLVGGDVVLIDTTQRMLNKQDGVYAISIYGAAAIKRLRTIGPQRIMVKSDNPRVDDQEVDAEDLIIAGRVIWFGREL
jgi:phage repressor protein C with HTH and peptisase S24 domain